MLAVNESLPMRERGLKHSDSHIVQHHGMSLPMRERGLKLTNVGHDMAIQVVAPHAGAWIETRDMQTVQRAYPRRSPCGSVD